MQADTLSSKLLKENVKILSLVQKKKKNLDLWAKHRKPARNTLVVVQLDTFTQFSKRKCKPWGPWAVSERRCCDGQLQELDAGG